MVILIVRLHHGWPWSRIRVLWMTMVDYGQALGILWMTMVDHGQAWENCEGSCSTMVNHGHVPLYHSWPWSTMVIDGIDHGWKTHHGQAWSDHGWPWSSFDCSMVKYGGPWLNHGWLWWTMVTMVHHGAILTGVTTVVTCYPDDGRLWRKIISHKF